MDFDYKKKRQGKVTEDEIKQALEKFDDSKEIAEQSMFNLLESDVRSVTCPVLAFVHHPFHASVDFDFILSVPIVPCYISSLSHFIFPFYFEAINHRIHLFSFISASYTMAMFTWLISLIITNT